MSGPYHLPLGVLSVLVAVMAAWTALDLTQRILSADRMAARLWVASGALVLGTAIWSMHFVGMLARVLPLHTGFDLGRTVLSWLVSVAVALTALAMAGRIAASLTRVLPGALLVGAGIALVFHFALSSLRITPAPGYDPVLLALAVLLVATATAIASLTLVKVRGLRGSRVFLLKVGCAVMAGLAGAAAHVLCMTAVRLAPGARSMAAHEIEPTWLGLTIAVSAIGFTWIGSVAALFDARMEHRTRQLAQRLRMANTELMHAAMHDPLTDLPNRANFESDLAEAAVRARDSGQRLAIFFIDLDGFKPVNDVLGHHVGDEVLRIVARRLRACLREGDRLARIGGDEFVLMSEGGMDRDQAGRMAQRLVDAAGKPMQIDTHDIQVSASVGVALCPDDGDDTRVLVCADTAMYAAKHAGRNTWRMYSAELDEHHADILGLQRAMRRALDNDEFVLHYQPKVGTSDGRLRGVEALIRWEDPDKGMITPAEFIPVAERFGLINTIGFWTLREACGQIRTWQHAGWRIPVAVNLSPQQFRQPDLLDRVRACIDEFDIDPALLALEITESVVMENSTSVQRALAGLRAMGVTLAIDDFGTGYSCLAYLCRLPARELKIDRTFVTDMDRVAEARHVVEAVIRMAHALRMEVVAEGVERMEQVSALRALGCDQVQGYCFSRPVPAAQIEVLLAEGRFGAPRPPGSLALQERVRREALIA
ncbi:putative bifunctional diguanylate cyclase/phosphodiesterase [Methyloversatilis thermotolerans]|uniref:putative bifunctional diguanylate cyclase/phosphodiesterase n=1 Tax=Methyloversatilis thermotolerans TaxID=1346290 RepID=UPI000373DF47|nr:EAL domain-containing protein [Methyloversatilis thermotolerans]